MHIPPQKWTAGIKSPHDLGLGVIISLLVQRTPGAIIPAHQDAVPVLTPTLGQQIHSSEENPESFKFASGSEVNSGSIYRCWKEPVDSRKKSKYSNNKIIHLCSSLYISVILFWNSWSHARQRLRIPIVSRK